LRPCFSRKEDYVEGILAEHGNCRRIVVFIQYSNDLFGEDNRFPRLLAKLRAPEFAGGECPFGVSGELENRHQARGTVADFDRAMAEHASRLQVHTQRMRRDLLERGIPDQRIVVIPHGSKSMEQHDSLRCRKELGLPENAKLVVFFGFIWPGKGLEFLLKVFKKVARQVPDAFLLVAGHTRNNPWGFYVTYLRARALCWGSAAAVAFGANT